MIASFKSIGCILDLFVLAGEFVVTKPVVYIEVTVMLALKWGWSAM